MADERPVLFSPADAKRIGRVVRRVETEPRFKTGLESQGLATRSPVQNWVQITSLTQTAGRYPGLWYLYDVDAETWAAGSASPIWVVGANAETLALSTRYRATAAGEVSGVMVFVAVAAGGSTATAFSGAKLQLSAGTSGDGDASETVQADVILYDTDGYASAVPGDAKFTIAVDGYYRLTAYGIFYVTVVSSETPNFWGNLATNITAVRMLGTASGFILSDDAFVYPFPTADPTLNFSVEGNLLAGDVVTLTFSRSSPAGNEMQFSNGTMSLAKIG